MSWGNDWKEVAEFEEDIEEAVREYVYETIRFFAVSSFDKILIESKELIK